MPRPIQQAFRTNAVVISNKQRRYVIDVECMESQATVLFAQTLECLKEDCPPHLSYEELDNIQNQASLSVLLVSDHKIRTLNKEWMNKDRPTDVLSFPLQLEPPPAGLPWELGELVISLQRTHEQALSYGHSFERELAFLFVHGTLHILGFDHQSKAEERDMFSRQKKILNNSGYHR